MEAILAAVQRLIGEVRKDVRDVIIALLIAMGSWGWLRYTHESDAHQATKNLWLKDKDAAAERLKKATDATIESQRQTNELQQIQIQRNALERAQQLRK